MEKLIRNRRVETDNWRLLRNAADGSPPPVPAEGDVIVPLSLWLARKDALSVRSGRTGVWLESKDSADAIASDLARLPLVAIEFPSIADGRGYSIAKLLREQHGYKGEVRAIGAVLKDVLLGMARCGIDAFALREGEDAEEALRAFDELPVAYQASVLQPQPLFRRRAAGA
jgi:uncharacterized protein (DUF934 family)